MSPPPAGAGTPGEQPNAGTQTGIGNVKKSIKGGPIMPKIDAAIGIRVTKDLKARLERQAKSEMKSVSALIIQVMEDYLSSHGNGKAQ